MPVFQDSGMIAQECHGRMSLSARPVLEMALNVDNFRREISVCLEEGRVEEVEYVMLKIAMEI